jgi:hypothetical protein
MKKVWPWIFGIAAGLIIIALISAGRSNRQSYRIARGAVEQRVEISQDRIDMAAQMATASVDLALKLAGDLPSQQAKADLVKQGIEEISSLLKEAAEARGDLAMTKLDASIDLFNKTMDAVQEASAAATDPALKSRLDRIYGILEATKEQIVQRVVNTQK